MPRDLHARSARGTGRRSAATRSAARQRDAADRGHRPARRSGGSRSSRVTRGGQCRIAAQAHTPIRRGGPRRDSTTPATRTDGYGSSGLLPSARRHVRVGTASVACATISPLYSYGTMPLPERWRGRDVVGPARSRYAVPHAGAADPRCDRFTPERNLNRLRTHETDAAGCSPRALVNARH